MITVLVPAETTPRGIGIRHREGFGYEPYSGCCNSMLMREGNDQLVCQVCNELKLYTERGLQYSNISSPILEYFRTWIAVYTGIDLDELSVTLS